MPAKTMTAPDVLTSPALLRNLAEMKGTCVTIYLGAHKPGSGSNAQRIRLVHMLSEAEALLNDRAVPPAEQDALLAPLAGDTDAELAAKGRRAMEGAHMPDLRHAVDLYMDAGPAKKTAALDGILREAAAGRVLHLFIAGEAADEAVNAAAVETWRHDGHVWCLDEPLAGAAVAAVFRW